MSKRFQDAEWRKGHRCYLKGDNREYRIIELEPGRVRIRPISGTPKDRLPIWTSIPSISDQQEFPYQETLPLF